MCKAFRRKACLAPLAFLWCGQGPYTTSSLLAPLPSSLWEGKGKGKVRGASKGNEKFRDEGKVPA